MTNALTVVQQGQPVMYVAPGKAKYSAAKSFLASGSGNKSQFAGTHLRWDGKDGQIIEGFGDKAHECGVNRFVLNVANTIRFWQYWPEDAKSPSYPYLCLPFAAQSLPSHDTVNPEGETRYNKLKKDNVSVYTEGLMLILRDPDTDRLYHMELYGSARSAAMSFMLENVDACEANEGHLPVIEITGTKVKLDDGGSYRQMVIELVDWAEITDVDNPGALAEAVEDVDTAPEDAEEAEEQEEPAEEQEEAEEAPSKPVKASPKAGPVVQRVSRGTSNAPAKAAPAPAPAPKPAPKAVAKPATFKPSSAKAPAAALVGSKIGQKKRPMKVADDEASVD